MELWNKNKEILDSNEFKNPLFQRSTIPLKKILAFKL
jgi:hypothetical protein